MPKIQIVTAMTIDGFLPPADSELMQWVMTDAKGFPYWHERSIYRLMPHYPLVDLVAREHYDTNKEDVYIAEVSDNASIELMQGLSRYRLIEEMVVYTLPLILGKGTPVFDDLTPYRWETCESATFPNGVSRTVFRGIPPQSSGKRHNPQRLLAYLKKLCGS